MFSGQCENNGNLQYLYMYIKWENKTKIQIAADKMIVDLVFRFTYF